MALAQIFLLYIETILSWVFVGLGSFDCLSIMQSTTVAVAATNPSQFIVPVPVVQYCILAVDHVKRAIDFMLCPHLNLTDCIEIGDPMPIIPKSPHENVAAHASIQRLLRIQFVETSCMCAN